jgi:hypothetical protein
MTPVVQFVMILGLAGAALLALALLVRGIFLGYPAPALAGALLSGKEQAIVGVCADTLFPIGGPIPLSGTEAGAVAYMDCYIARVDRTQQLLLRLLLHAVEHSPWLFGPRRTRFTRLSHEERVTALRAMSRSRIYLRRVMFLSLRVVLTMAYLANDEVARRVGMVARAAPFEEAGGALGAARLEPEPRAAERMGEEDLRPHSRPEIRPSRGVLA